MQPGKQSWRRRRRRLRPPSPTPESRCPAPRSAAAAAAGPALSALAALPRGARSGRRVKGEAGGGGLARAPRRPARPAPTGRPGGRGQPPGELGAARAPGWGSPRPSLRVVTVNPRAPGAARAGGGDGRPCAARRVSNPGPRGGASRPPVLSSGRCRGSEGKKLGDLREDFAQDRELRSLRSSPLTRFFHGAGIQMGRHHFHLIFAFNRKLLNGKSKAESVGGGGAAHWKPCFGSQM